MDSVFVLRRFYPFALLVAALLMPICASADTIAVSLDAEADPTSNFIAYFSEGIAQLNMTYSGTDRQPFWNTNNLSQTYNANFDFFPNDSAMRFGEITYDDSSLNLGSGTTSITGLTLGIDTDPFDTSYINGRWLSFTTNIDIYSGSVTVDSGVVTHLDLTVSYVTSGSFGPVPFAGNGTFSVVGDHFEVQASASNLEFDPSYDPAMAWDWTGTILEVAPEPSSGDFDLDGDVDGQDYLTWARNRSVGDIANWQSHYGSGISSTSTVVVVPEPDAISLALATLCVLAVPFKRPL